MLNSLLIKNFALIKESKLSFKENFISITGETGAGKSIMLEALHLALGGRKARSGIHQDAQKCIIEVSFILKREAVISWFEKEDVDFHEVTFIRRELLNSGRSRSFVNDTPVSLDVVKELSNNLLKIHTQDDHTELNDAKNQLKIVDDYSENRSFLNDYKRTFESWKAGKQDLERLLKKKSEALKNYEFNQFQLKEFESVDLENTHLDEVKEEYEVLKNASEIIQSSSEAIQVIGDNGAMNQINKAIDILKPHVQIDKIDRLINRLQGARIELKDIFYDLESLARNTEVNPSRIVELEEFLNSINSLLYKHGSETIADLQLIKNNIEKELLDSQSFDSLINQKEEEIQMNEKKLDHLSKKLSTRRKQKSKDLIRDVHQKLNFLKMSKTQIDIEFVDLEDYSLSGRDAIRFLMSSDDGKSFNLLSKTASGGEKSRINLALKSALANKYAIPTLVFDEIDTGVSGEVATKMGKLLKDMAVNRQIISVTHLPQVASLAQQHFAVYKNDQKGIESSVSELNDTEKIEEVAKMLSGDLITNEARENAKVLIAAN